MVHYTANWFCSFSFSSGWIICRKKREKEEKKLSKLKTRTVLNELVLLSRQNLKSRLIKFLLISLKCLRCVIIVGNLWHALFTTEAAVHSKRPNFRINIHNHQTNVSSFFLSRPFYIKMTFVHFFSTFLIKKAEYFLRIINEINKFEHGNHFSFELKQIAFVFLRTRKRQISSKLNLLKCFFSTKMSYYCICKSIFGNCGTNQSIFVFDDAFAENPLHWWIRREGEMLQTKPHKRMKCLSARVEF